MLIDPEGVFEHLHTPFGIGGEQLWRMLHALGAIPTRDGTAQVNANYIFRKTSVPVKHAVYILKPLFLCPDCVIAAILALLF